MSQERRHPTLPVLVTDTGPNRLATLGGLLPIERFPLLNKVGVHRTEHTLKGSLLEIASNKLAATFFTHKFPPGIREAGFGPQEVRQGYERLLVGDPHLIVVGTDEIPMIFDENGVLVRRKSRPKRAILGGRFRFEAMAGSFYTGRRSARREFVGIVYNLKTYEKLIGEQDGFDAIVVQLAIAMAKAGKFEISQASSPESILTRADFDDTLKWVRNATRKDDEVTSL